MSFFEALWYTFSCWMVFLGNYFMYALVEGLDLILSGFLWVIAGILWLLPHFTLEKPSLDGTGVNWLNYFVPINMLLLAFSTIMFCWIMYRIYVVALRWMKVADDS